MPLIEISSGQTIFSNVASMVGSQAATEILIQANPSNTESVLIGNATNQYIRLSAGVTITLPISNLNQIYGKVSTNVSATVNWITNTLRF